MTTKADRHCECAIHSNREVAALVEEHDRLKAVIASIAESVIVQHICVRSSLLVEGCCQTTLGCGICQGEYQGYDRPDGRGVYAHKPWCPRK